MSNEKAVRNQNPMEGQSTGESRKTIENRKEDKKAFRKFIVITIISGLVGGVVGYTSFGVTELPRRIAELIGPAVSTVALFGNIIISTVMLIALSLLMVKSRRSFKEWDGEDEYMIERIERNLTYGFNATFVHMVIGYFLFGAGVYVLDIVEAGRNMSLPGAAVALLGFVYAMIVMMWFQKEIVNFTKEINPEKQGSIYDAKFQKKWMDSCDELERLQIYKAGYKAYSAVNYTCMGLWVFTTFGIMIWDFGMLPMTMVTIIWLVAGVTYGAECMRSAKNSPERMQ